MESPERIHANTVNYFFTVAHNQFHGERSDFPIHGAAPTESPNEIN